MMKKNAKILIAVAALIVLGVAAWLCGYHSNKSNDNLPTLASVATMDEAAVEKLLLGYRKIQLREVWKEPDETGASEDVWIIDEKTALVVNYSEKDKVTACRLSAGE